jgi:uncharacterized repeat protein (TIGR03803 family)
MHSKTLSLRFSVALAMFALVSFSMPPTATAQTEKILYNFNNTGAGGDIPNAGLVFDSSGNLYSTTEAGSLHNGGTVFELSPPTTGTHWTEKLLHIFGSFSSDGDIATTGVTLDSAGNVYGVALSGGAGGLGDVFELMPKAGGGWREKILHSFIQNGTDGTQPEAGVILDAAGNLYGTTYTGGPSVGGNLGYGTVYELTPNASGEWTETILHQFAGGNADGAYPYASLIMDASGNFYGTTSRGGSGACTYGCGTVFKLTPGSGGTWTETILHVFSGGSDGGLPQGSLVMDAAGNLYGTTLWGGKYCSVCGTAFELSPSAGGAWTETVLHSFGAFPVDGLNPASSLVLDSTGNLYGTAVGGGLYGRGMAFELTPKAGGGWAEKTLHHFGNGKDGQLPDSNLIFDSSGNLYGTTVNGGTYGYGTVFELTS